MKGPNDDLEKTADEAAQMKLIRQHFTVETAPRQKNKWLVVCEKCGDMWHLDKNSKHPGNVLHLLNHARGH